MQLIEHQKRINALKQRLGTRPEYKVLLALLSSAQYMKQDYPNEKEYCYKVSGFVKQWAVRLTSDTKDPKFLDLYYQCLLFEAIILDLHGEEQRSQKEILLAETENIKDSCK